MLFLSIIIISLLIIIIIIYYYCYDDDDDDDDVSIRPTESLLHSKLGRIETSNPLTSASTPMHIYDFII